MKIGVWSFYSDLFTENKVFKNLSSGLGDDDLYGLNELNKFCNLNSIQLITLDLVEDFNNLGVIVWIQDDNSKEILQSTTASLVNNIDENLITSNNFKIFPNPASEIATIAYQGFDHKNVEFKITEIHLSMISTVFADFWTINVMEFLVFRSQN